PSAQGSIARASKPPCADCSRLRKSRTNLTADHHASITASHSKPNPEGSLQMDKYYGRNMLHEVDPADEGTFNTNPYPKGFSTVSVRPGKSGEWTVSTFKTGGLKLNLSNLRLIRDGRRDRVVPLGEYTKLSRNGALVMSDTPAEATEHFGFYTEAHGDVLIAGLGLGFVLQAILTKPTVKSITVIERSTDVIKLVNSSIADDRVKVINADILTWRPPKRETWTVAWFDIWDNISSNNKPEMRQLMKKFAIKAGWKGCWSAVYQ